jgi:hypothetical protein
MPLPPASGFGEKNNLGVDALTVRRFDTTLQYGRTLEKLWLRSIWDENLFPLPVFSVHVISDTLLG